MSQAAIAGRSPYSLPYTYHRPEQTLLHHIIERHYPAFRDVMAAQGKSLPQHVQNAFADYLKCGRLEHGFLRVQCTECHHEHAGSVQLQAARVLPQLWRKTHGGECRTAG